jgi:hypothetical protein
MPSPAIHLGQIHLIGQMSEIIARCSTTDAILVGLVALASGLVNA